MSNDNTVSSGIEEHAAWFAARYWGGEGIEPQWRDEPIYGRYDIDGGRPSYGPCWTFYAEFGTYVVYEADEDRWVMTCLLDDSGAEFYRVDPPKNAGGPYWMVRRFYQDNWERVPVR